MNAVIDQEFRADLRETVRSVLGRVASPTALRPTIEARERPAVLEAQIATLGWTGLEIPEEHGGAGASFGDLAVILHELGRVVSPSAFATATVLGVGAVLAGSDEQQARWLPALAAGEALVTAALTGVAGTRGALDMSASATAGGWSLAGVSGFVPDLRDADAVVVAALDTTTADTMLFLLPADAPGVTIEPCDTVDRTRRLDRLILDGAVVGAEQRLGPPERGHEIRERLLTRAALAVACDGVGGAERVLELTVEHLSTREQFGRPLGSFQALKHRCADMLYVIEGSRSAVDHAASQLALGDDEAAATAVSVAKSYGGDAYVDVAQQGVQLHGGIGYTWEHDLHLHLKRARLNQLLFGDSAWHRRVLAGVALDQS